MLAVTGLLVAPACGSDAKRTAAPNTLTAPASLAGTATPTPTPAPTTRPPESPSATPTVKPPEHAGQKIFGFARSVDVPARRLTYDKADFLTGEAANKAAAADGQDTPVPNDYYIRNVNPLLRTDPIAPAAVIRILVSGGSPEHRTATHDQFGDRVTEARDRGYALLWLTFDKAGRIVRIEEQFVP